MESPFDDFLCTPGLRNDDFAQDFTSPLIVDGEGFGAPFRDTPLFEDAGLFEPSSTDKRAASQVYPAVNLDTMYSFSPPTPVLDASPLFAHSPCRLSSSLPIGARKNLTPDALTPLDSPVQSRNHPPPPATPRRNTPRKRSRTEAFGSDDESNQNMAEPDTVASGPSKSTVATHRSRKRKPDPQVEPEANIEREDRPEEELRRRVIELEAVLRSHGIPVPPPTMHEHHSKVS